MLTHPNLILYLPGILTPDGKLADCSGRGNHGTITGAVPTQTPYGPGLVFNGDDRVTAAACSELTGAKPRSMGTWFYADQVSNEVIMGQGTQDVTGDLFYMGIQGWAGSGLFWWYSGTSGGDVPITPIAGQWWHIGMSYGADNIVYWYVNGEFYRALTPSRTINSTPNTSFYLGSSWTGHFFKGTLAHSTVWNCALSGGDWKRVVMGLPPATVYPA